MRWMIRWDIQIIVPWIQHNIFPTCPESKHRIWQSVNSVIPISIRLSRLKLTILTLQNFLAPLITRTILMSTHGDQSVEFSSVSKHWHKSRLPCAVLSLLSGLLTVGPASASPTCVRKISFFLFSKCFGSLGCCYMALKYGPDDLLSGILPERTGKQGLSSSKQSATSVAI